MYFGEFEITIREIIISISMLLLGVFFILLITNEIKDSYVGINDEYLTADVYNTQDQFDFGLSGGTGPAFIKASITTDTTVSLPEITEEYVYISRVKEKYSPHTRMVSYPCGKNTCFRTETYYSWDVVEQNTQHVDYIYINNYKIDWESIRGIDTKVTKLTDVIDKSIEISGKSIKKVDSKYVIISTSLIERKTRYYYKTIKLDDIKDSALFVNFENGEMKPEKSDKFHIYTNTNTEQLADKIMKSPAGWYALVWVLGLIVTGTGIFIFYYAENNWLHERKQHG